MRCDETSDLPASVYLKTAWKMAKTLQQIGHVSLSIEQWTPADSESNAVAIVIPIAPTSNQSSLFHGENCERSSRRVLHNPFALGWSLCHVDELDRYREKIDCDRSEATYLKFIQTEEKTDRNEEMLN